MVSEERVGGEKHAEACLKRLRGSRLKSETLRSVIHILSRCYEDPKAAKLFSQDPTEPGGVSSQGDKHGESRGNLVQDEMPADTTEMKLDVVEDILTHEMTYSQLGDDQQMQFSVNEIENLIMDVDGIQEPGQGFFINQESLQQVQNTLLETAGLENGLDESLPHKNGFSDIVEFDLSKGEAAQCGNKNDKCFPSQNDAMARDQHLNRPNDMLESDNGQTSVHRTNVSNDIEEGEINSCNGHVQSRVSQESNIHLLQHSETCVNQPNVIKHRKMPEDASRPGFESSILVSNVDNEDLKYHQACAESMPFESLETPNPTSAAKIKGSVATVANDEFKCPIDSRKPIFYGDISEETSPNAQRTLIMDADLLKKKKRGGNCKEKRKIQKRKKRAELDKKLGVKRMKLPPALKPKLVKVCEHYLKGRCLKGEECTFSHDATPLTKSKACIHFARNNCMKGDACPYDHQLWKYPCDNYASKGFCNRGSSCSFSHEQIPAKEGSQGASTTEKLSLKATPTPGTASKSPVNSAAKIPIIPPMQVPKGLNFLSFGKSGSECLTGPNSSRSPQKVDLIGLSNHSIHNVPGIAKTLNVTSNPFAAPVTSNNDPYLGALSDHSNSNKNSVPKVGSSRMMVDSTSPLDQALLGLNSLVSCKVPINGFSSKCSIGLSAKEHIPPVSCLSGLGMHQSSGPSVRKEKSGLKVVNQKGKISNSAANMQVEATQEKVPTEVHCFSSDKSSAIKLSQKLHTTIPKDQKTNKKISIHPGSQSAYDGNPHSSIAEELKTPISAPSSSSQGLAANKSMPSSVQKALFSTLTFASKFESESKGPSIGSSGNSQFKKEAESSRTSSSRSSEPVKASAILDFIFGTGRKTLQ